MTKLFHRILPFITTLGFGAAWLIVWIEFVDPFPDRDSINQFYFPFLNYLQASKLLSIDHKFLIDNTFSTSYPSGGAVFPWLISVTGSQDFFIQKPFYIFLILLPALACVPYFFKIDNKTRVLLGILVIALPVTQLSLKGFSLQGFNVIFCLIAILAFRSYLAQRRIFYLFVFICCFWLAIIPKHLGAFYLLNFILVYGVWIFKSRKVDAKVIISIIVTVLLSAPFYNLQNLKTYLINVMTHNPYLSVTTFFLIGGSIFLIGALILALIKRKSAKKSIPRFRNAPLVSFVLFCFATYLTTVSYDAQIGSIDVLLFFLIGYGFLSWFLIKHETCNTRGFVLLFCAITYVNSTLLFCSMIGKTYYNFFLPIILVSIIEFIESKKIKNRLIFVLTALVISNFFPSISNIQKLMGERGENIYINGFNAVYVNPLGWQYCQIPSLRDELVKLYSSLKFESESSLYIADKIHFHTKLGLEFPVNYFYPFPSIYRLDNLPPERIRTLINEYQMIGEKVFERWLQVHKIPLLLIGQASFTNFVGDPPDMKSILKNEEFDLNDVARSLSREFLKFLETNEHLNNFYSCQSIPADKARLKVCISKKLETATINDGKWNRSLSDLATAYEMTHKRPLPKWINNLDNENRLRLSQKRAGTLYENIEGDNDYTSRVKVYSKLRKVIELDPSHVGALEDALAIQEEFTSADWTKLSESYKPINRVSLENALSSKVFADNESELKLLKSLNNQQRAHHLFMLSNRYFSSDPKRCIDLLKKVIQLNPSHPEALKDLAVLEKHTSNEIEK